MASGPSSRSVLRLLHRWLGLIGGSFLVVLGLTGSVLVYESEIGGWLRPAFHAPLPDLGAEPPPPDYERAISAALSQLPPLASAMLAVPEDPRRPLRLHWLADDDSRQFREASLHPQRLLCPLQRRPKLALPGIVPPQRHKNLRPHRLPHRLGRSGRRRRRILARHGRRWRKQRNRGCAGRGRSSLLL